jgi:hypothetical protein
MKQKECVLCSYYREAVKGKGYCSGKDTFGAEQMKPCSMVKPKECVKYRYFLNGLKNVLRSLEPYKDTTETEPCTPFYHELRKDIEKLEELYST